MTETIVNISRQALQSKFQGDPSRWARNAAQAGDVSVLRLARSAGADMNAGDGTGIAPAILAVVSNKPDALLTVVELGGNINAQSKTGYTAAHFAAYFGYSDVFATAVSLGADLNITDQYGSTPRMVAETRGHQDIVQYIDNMLPVRPIAVRLDDLVNAFGQTGAEELVRHSSPNNRPVFPSTAKRAPRLDIA